MGVAVPKISFVDRLNRPGENKTRGFRWGTTKKRTKKGKEYRTANGLMGKNNLNPKNAERTWSYSLKTKVKPPRSTQTRKTRDKRKQENNLKCKWSNKN